LKPDWSNFYLATGAAAAALTALLFVAVALRPAEIRVAPATLGRARGAFYALATVMVVSLVSLAPLSDRAVGVAQATASLVGVAMSVPLVIAVIRAGQLRANMLRITLYYASFALIAGAAVARAAGLPADNAQPLFAAAAIVLMVVGLNNAWVLVLTHQGRG
jgi:hypothetical protein